MLQAIHSIHYGSELRPVSMETTMGNRHYHVVNFTRDSNTGQVMNLTNAFLRLLSSIHCYTICFLDDRNETHRIQIQSSFWSAFL